MADRIRQWKTLDRQKAAYRQAMRPVFMRAFDKQIQPLYDRIQEVSDIRDLEVPPLNNAAIKQAYQKLYLATAVPFAVQKRKAFRRKLATKRTEMTKSLKI